MALHVTIFFCKPLKEALGSLILVMLQSIAHATNPINRTLLFAWLRFFLQAAAKVRLMGVHFKLSLLLIP
ncbi:MAG: hypothetical protein LBK18_03755 [Prevotellaceae bacterium]|nr:hypothetical protein [Prevotellaceae bacterium]